MIKNEERNVEDKDSNIYQQSSILLVLEKNNKYKK